MGAVPPRAGARKPAASCALPSGPPPAPAAAASPGSGLCPHLLPPLASHTQTPSYPPACTCTAPQALPALDARVARCATLHNQPRFSHLPTCRYCLPPARYRPAGDPGPGRPRGRQAGAHAGPGGGAGLPARVGHGGAGGCARGVGPGAAGRACGARTWRRVCTARACRQPGGWPGGRSCSSSRLPTVLHGVHVLRCARRRGAGARAAADPGRALPAAGGHAGVGLRALRQREAWGARARGARAAPLMCPGPGQRSAPAAPGRAEPSTDLGGATGRGRAAVPRL